MASTGRSWTCGLAIGALLTASMGCGAHDEQSLCAAAAQKIADCTQQPPMPVAQSCTAEAAEAIISSRCVDLTPARGKALDTKDVLIGAAVVGVIGVGLAWLFSGDDTDGNTQVAAGQSPQTQVNGYPASGQVQTQPAAYTPVSAPGTSCQLGTPGVWLWRADKSGHLPVYLFGTMHRGILPHEIPQCVWEKLRDPATTVAAAERDVFSEQEEPEPTEDELQRAQLPQGMSLQQIIPPRTWNGLRRLLPKFDPDVLDRLHPQLLGSLIYAMAHYTELLRNGQTEQLDTTMILQAQRAGKEVRYFETDAFHAELDRRLAQLEQDPNLQESIEYLVRAVDDPYSRVRQERQLAQQYRSGDIDALTRSALSGDPRENELLLFERNRAWIPLIEQWSRGPGGQHYGRREQHFYFVGAGHLVGPGSVVELLRQRGWEIVHGPALPTYQPVST